MYVYVVLKYILGYNVAVFDFKSSREKLCWWGVLQGKRELKVKR